MLEISNIAVSGFEAAIRGMRNPKNSWHKSDSEWDDKEQRYILGKNDLGLSSILSAAGDDHGKFLRMIHFSCDIEGPAFWISELDTYKVGTTRNSCSLQLKGDSRPFTLDDFSHPDFKNMNQKAKDDYLHIMNEILFRINGFREWYHETGNYEYFLVMRRIIPMNYIYHFTWDADYQTLKHIYHARKTHPVKEWHVFCEMIENLPYSKELIIGEEKMNANADQIILNHCNDGKWEIVYQNTSKKFDDVAEAYKYMEEIRTKE